MEKQEPKYGLRSRKSDFKGKYREMLGVNASPVSTSPERKEPIKGSDTESVINENKECEILVLPQDRGEKCKIFVVPIVMSEGEDVLVEGENAIEVEIAEDGTLTELTDEGGKTTLTLDALSKKGSDPLNHIEEILKHNNELIQSIPDVPFYKSRRKAKEADDSTEDSTLVTNQDTLMHQDSNITTMKSSEVLDLTIEVVQSMLVRPLPEDEKQHIEILLKEGKKDIVLQTLFGSEAESRVRKCSICCCLIEGPDDVYASHYSETHACEPTFSCELCSQVSEKPSTYFSHLESHFKLTSPSKKKISKSDVSRKEDSGEPFVCDICGKTLKHQKSLYSHRRTHTDAKAVCHICGATLKSSRYLHHHLLLHKDVEKPHKCEKCGKAFFSSSALKVHHYYNHEEHPGRFQCNICGKNFKAKQGLQFHMDSHSTELRYECQYCHKKFRGFKTCRVHELRHREANEPNKFNCEVCGKLFKTRQTLKNHEDVHASFNRYQCSLCEKRFKLRKSCLAHIRVHHNDQESKHASTAVTDEGEMAVESLLASGEEYVVTLEDNGEVDSVLLDGEEQPVELIVPEAHVECEVEHVT